MFVSRYELPCPLREARIFQQRIQCHYRRGLLSKNIAFSIERCNLLPLPRRFRRTQRGVLMFNAEAASIDMDPS